MVRIRLPPAVSQANFSIAPLARAISSNTSLDRLVLRPSGSAVVGRPSSAVWARWSASSLQIGRIGTGPPKDLAKQHGHDHRAHQPFSAPGSLSNDEVYAVTAYILAEGDIIEKATVIDAETLPKVQMPNRDGFVPEPRPELFK